MSKCPNCGLDVDAGMKFCGECGTQIPQTKECPACHEQLPLSMKFCGNCGYNFNAASSGAGSVIGDKNVIAGDVHIDQSSTVNNTTVNNVTNNTSSTTIINQDETKQLVACCVCSRQMAVVDAFVCSQCHGHVCRDHYDADAKMCSLCEDRVSQSTENIFKAAAKKIIDSGIVGIEEGKQLSDLAAELGIDDFNQKKIIDDVHLSKGNLIKVNLVLSGTTMRIGREPFKCKDDVESADNAKMRSPEGCLDNIYVFNCYEIPIVAQATWTSIDDELNRIEAKLDDTTDENGGVRFEEIGETYRPAKGCEATLFVTEHSNATDISLRGTVLVHDEFDPAGLVIKYKEVQFDHDLKVVWAIEYFGRKIKFGAVGNEPRGDSYCCHDSWVAFSDGVRCDYNVMAPCCSRYTKIRLEGFGAKVFSCKFTDANEAESFINALDPSSASSQFLTIDSNCSRGNFFLADGVKVSRVERLDYVAKVLTDYKDEDAGELLDILTNYECELEGDEVQLSYFEVHNACCEVEMFALDDYVKDDNFSLWSRGGEVCRVVSAIGYRAPSFGKCQDYYNDADDFYVETDIHGDDANIKMEEGVVRRFILVTKCSDSRVIEI